MDQLTKQEKERLIEIAKEVQTDCESDAQKIDGQPFNGRTLGVITGEHLAMIRTLASLAETCLRRIELLEMEIENKVDKS